MFVVAVHGCWVLCVQVELVQETPGWLQLSVAGLQKPLELTYWQREDVIRVKVRRLLMPHLASVLSHYIVLSRVNLLLPLQAAVRTHQLMLPIW
jgi:hypothetical protein